jgi:DNA-binding GntR family transcriptional regulator
LTVFPGPLFKQLARTIAEAIEVGAIAVGDLLPTEAELSRRHGVSRHTVREALGELRSMGLIESRQGVGSIVVRRDVSATYTETYSSIEELTRFAKGTPIKTYRVEDVVVDDEVAGRLRGRPGQAYVRILGLRYDREQGNSPVGHVEVHVDGTYSGIRDHVHGLKASVAETIERLYGVSIARIEQEIAVELLDSEQAERLAVPPQTPALVIRRWYKAETGRIFEIAFSRYPMGRFAYRNVLVRSRI